MEELSWKEWWEDYRYACGYDGTKPRKIAAYIRWLRHLINSAICSHTGHNIEDTSGGTPDRGWMSGYCRRCGWSYHKILY